MIGKSGAERVVVVLAGAILWATAQPCLASDNPRAGTPEGFGAGTTGGTGGEVVRVATADELKYQLCRSYDRSGACSDTAPRIIELATTIDYTGSEGTRSGEGCYPYNICRPPYKTEALVLLNSSDSHCDGKTTTSIPYDSAGRNPLLVGSNKTLIGVGTKGIVKGKGLRLYQASNVIIRNITISDINEGIVFAGDAISLDDVDHVWIDHNRFRGIGRQMIVDGFGPAMNVTISWNDFDGRSAYSTRCDGTHYWNVLLDAERQTVTLSNNWFHQFAGRAPRVAGDQAVVHLVNNQFDDGSWHALDAGAGSNVLVEGNAFDRVSVPVMPKRESGFVFAALGDGETAMQDQCKAALGRKCVGNIANPMPRDHGFRQDASVMRAFQTIDGARIVQPYAASAVPDAVRTGAGPGHL